MTTAERYRAILGNHLPEQAVDTVYAYLDRHKVHFHITRGRRSKLGDYRRPFPGHQYHEMSVNGDLNPYMFLLVFLHEAAHLETHLNHPEAQPHGHEWQSEYAKLLCGQAHLFPPDVQPLVRAYASRVPLSGTIRRQLEERLSHYGEPASETPIRLDSLAPGTLFRLKSKPDLLLRSDTKRRTRWLCTDVGTGRQYTVAGSSEVLVED